MKTWVLGACTAALAAGAAAAAAAPTTAPPRPSPSTQMPQAAAWLADIVVLSPSGLSARLADVRASSSGPMQAWAAPLTVNGTSTKSALATKAEPSRHDAAVDYTDKTGTISMTGGYARAEVSGSSVTASGGLATGSGNSFALASKLLSWDQQKNLTDEVAAINDAVVDPLNVRLAALAPVFGVLGLPTPQVSKMSALAVINIGSGDGVAATASTAYAPGLASARATSTLASVQLFDDFIRVDGIRATATSEAVDATQTKMADATIVGLRIAGIDAVADDTGIHAAGQSLFSRAALQPALDLVLRALADSGVTIRTDETASAGDRREATAFDVSLAAPQGVISVSLGHAEATATAAAAPTSGAVPPPSPPAATPVIHTTPVASPPAASAEPPPAPVTTLAGVAAPVAGPATVAARQGVPAWLGATLPAAVARALASVFVLVLLGGLGVAVIPAVVMRTRRAHRTRLVRTSEVRS